MIFRRWRAFNYILFVMVFLGVQGCATPKARSRPPIEAVHNSKKGFFDQMRRWEPIYARRTGPNSLKKRSSESSFYFLPEGPFQWPLHAVEVTSQFGQRGSEFHEGIDLRAKTGTAVYAAKSGVVLYADSKIRGYGKMVVIRHEPEVATIYAHNSKLVVHPGQKIRKGQLIAVSGKTGHVTGPHVHFEIRHGATAVDPQRYLPHPQRNLGLAPSPQLNSGRLTAQNN